MPFKVLVSTGRGITGIEEGMKRRMGKWRGQIIVTGL